MNNKMYGTWFKRSARDGQNDHILSVLDWASMADQDAIEISRNIEEIELFQMHGILKCTEAEYDLHYRAYAGGSDDKGEVRRPFSPLTGEHVLNYCRYIEVHPVDLIASAISPTASTPPHIYQALVLLKDKAIYAVDRYRAEEALRVEAARFGNFVDSNPKVADYFALIAEFDVGRTSAHNFKQAAIRTLKSNQDKVLRPFLLSVFQDKSCGRLAHSAYDHFDDYQSHQLAVVDEKMKALAEKEADHQENIADLRGHLAMLYGREGAEFFYEALNYDVERLHRENKTTVIDAMYDKAQKLGSTEAVRAVCERAYGLYKDGADIALSGRVLLDERTALDEYEEWLKAVQAPEAFYMFYLYVNRSMSGHFEMPEVAPLQAYISRQP